MIFTKVSFGGKLVFRKGHGDYMKIFRQLIIIIGIYFICEALSKGLSLPIPGNILGMILLLVLLSTKTIKLDQVEEVSNFFLSHLSFFFIPAGVGLLASFDIVKASFIEIVLICILTTVITIVVTGKTAEYFLNKKSNSKEENNNGTHN